MRYDFGDDEWLMRESTFLPVDGSLFFIGPRKGGIALEELDGDRLRVMLQEAVGRLPKDQSGGPQRLASFLVRKNPVRA